MPKNVYPKQWLSGHTYNTCSVVDKEYIDFADSVYDVVRELCPMIIKSMRVDLAVAITSYLEDKQSQMNLFSSFVRMFNCETGASHPFEAQFGDVVSPERIRSYFNGNYDEGGVNSIDLAYILATRSQLPASGADSYFETAEQLIERLKDLGYMHLPSNDAYFESLCDIVELGGFKGFLDMVLWLLEKSYFLSPVTAIPVNTHELKEASSMYRISDHKAATVAIRRRGFSPSWYGLGVRPATFMEEFSRKNELDAGVTETLSDIEFHSFSLFEIIDIKPEKTNVKTLGGDILEISTKDIPVNVIKKGHHLPCELIRYGTLWHPLHVPCHLTIEIPQSKKDELLRAQERLKYGVRHR